MIRQRWLIAAGAAIALLGGLYVSSQIRTTDQAPVKEVRFDHLVLPDLSGREQHFSQWQGKVLLVNFWATWCPPCVKEIPIFMRLREKYTAQGFEVVGIAIDDAQKVHQFSQDMEINYPLILGDEQGIQLMQQFQSRLGALPYSVLFDRQGRAVHFKSGDFSESELENLVRQYLKPADPS